MLAWFLIGGAFFLMDAFWAFALALGLVFFFPKLARAAFAFVAFPVWTLWCCTWLFFIGWFFNFCPFTLEAWKSCFWITSIPVGLILAYTGNAAINELSL